MTVPSTTQESIAARLKKVEGQVRGVQRMLEEGRDCEDVLTQLMAARAGLERAGLLLLDSHLEACVLKVGEDQQACLDDLQKAVRLWTRFSSHSLPDG
jgi:DNA-binding FrmR family transcriptional regulator